MPIYDYSCTNCGHVTEVIHGINDHGPTTCPSCGAVGTMKKALSTPAIVFKGSGWAKVDRRSSSSTSGAKPSRGKANDSGSGAADGGSKGGSAASGSAASGSSGASAGGSSADSGSSSGNGAGAKAGD